MSLQSRGFPVFSRVSRAAMTLTFLVAAAVGAQAESWRATYSVSLLGLPIGTAGIVGEINRTSYRIEGNAKLTGLGQAAGTRARQIPYSSAVPSRRRVSRSDPCG